jgi:hypothetical protein
MEASHESLMKYFPEPQDSDNPDNVAEVASAVTGNELEQFLTDKPNLIEYLKSPTFHDMVFV